jgi:acyl carrier protein
MIMVSALKQLLAGVRGDPALLDLPDSASLVDDVRLDSLELLTFMLEIEAKLAVRIDFERLDYDHLGSLAELAAFLDAP